MANRAGLLEARVRQLDAAGQRSSGAGRRGPHTLAFFEQWRPFLVGFYHTEEGVFTNNNIDHGVFSVTISLVSNIPGDLPEKLGAIVSLIEYLVFLYIQLSEGVEDRIHLLPDFFRCRRRPAVGHLLATGWRGSP